MAGLVMLGFVAGFYTNHFVTQQKIAQVAELRFAMGFERRLFEIVDATPEQRETLRPIIEKYADANAEVYQQLRATRAANMDSMLAEIKPYLTEQQVENLREFARRFRSEHERRRKNHGDWKKDKEKFKEKMPRREKEGE